MQNAQMPYHGGYGKNSPKMKVTRAKASGIVFSDLGQILVVRYLGENDKLVFPGGGIEPYEAPHVAALREIFEETGVTAEIVDANPAVRLEFAPNWLVESLPAPICTIYYREYECLDYIYLCKYVSGETVAQESEISAAIWLTLEQLESASTYENVKQLARIAMTVLQQSRMLVADCYNGCYGYCADNAHPF